MVAQNDGIMRWEDSSNTSKLFLSFFLSVGEAVFYFISGQSSFFTWKCAFAVAPFFTAVARFFLHAGKFGGDCFQVPSSFFFPFIIHCKKTQFKISPSSSAVLLLLGVP